MAGSSEYLTGTPGGIPSPKSCRLLPRHTRGPFQGSPGLLLAGHSIERFRKAVAGTGHWRGFTLIRLAAAFQQDRIDSLLRQCIRAGGTCRPGSDDDARCLFHGFYRFSILQGLYLWIGVPVMGSLRSAEMSSFAFTPICSSSPVSLLVWTSPKPWGTETLPG